ncbi:MAG: carboxylesterase family protein [Saprospiraceae bacterium]|nr:carboxylesterase family protein [Saprospiraceae bacterium]
MKHLIPGLIIFLFFPKTIFSQGWCNGSQVLLNEFHTVDSQDVVYKTATQIDEFSFNVPVDVRLKVFYPNDLQPGEKRPLITLVHGGFFIGGDYKDFNTAASALAQKGFVAATIGYRLCRRVDCLLAQSTGNFCNLSWGNSFMPSAYVATVDVNDGIRWLQDHHSALHLDPDRIAVVGGSAGAYTAFNVAFTQQAEMQQVIPSAGTGGKYLNETLDPVSGIRAVVSLAGGMFSTEWINQEITTDNIAVGIFHGTHDGIVGYDDDRAIPCCNTYQTLIHGGCSIAERVRDLGGTIYLNTGQGFGHDAGDPQWAQQVLEQLPAFLVKTVVCGETFQQHTLVQRNPPLPECSGWTAPPVCDALPIGPPITTSAPNEYTPTATLSLQPNITSDVARLTVTSPDDEGEWYLQIVRLDGHEIQHQRIQILPEYVLDLSAKPSGMYLLVLKNFKTAQKQVLKIIKKP